MKELKLFVRGLFLRKSMIVLKLFGMILSFLAYSACVYFYSSDFVRIHASLLVIFGVFKAGAGFEAISSGKSALKFVTRSFVIRICLSIAWFGLISSFSSIEITPIVIFAIPLAFLWLRSFDGHVSGQAFWSFINSLVPSFTIIVLGCCFFFGLNIYGYAFSADWWGKITIWSFPFVVVCVFFLKGARVNTTAEIFHSTISPLLLFYLSSIYTDSKGLPFIFYRMCEGLAQICIFLLSSNRKECSILISFKNLAFIFFMVIFPLLILGELLGEAQVAVVSGVFILCYYIGSFFVVRFTPRWSIPFIILVLTVIGCLKILQFSYVQYAFLSISGFLLFLHFKMRQKLDTI